MELLMPFARGFVVNAGMIAAIGAINAFVLRQGVLRQHLLVTVLFCALADTLLILVGAAGLGLLISQVDWLLKSALWAGVVFLLWYAWLTLRSDPEPEQLILSSQGNRNLRKTLLVLMGLYFINPQTLVEVVVLIGSMAAQYPDDQRLAFTVGCILSSWVWFFGFGYGAKRLSHLLSSRTAWLWMNRITAMILVIVAVSMARQALMS